MPGFTVSRDGEEFVCVGPGAQVRFNPSVNIVWQLSDGSLTVDDMVALLKDAYPEQADQVANDVAGALTILRLAGAISDA